MLRKQTEQSPDAAVPQILEGVEILEQYQIDTIQVCGCMSVLWLTGGGGGGGGGSVEEGRTL